MNSPVNFNDPTGHMCSDPEDPNPTCDGSGGLPPNPPAPINGGGNDGGGGNDDLGDELEQDECTYHLCSDTNLYELGWENFGQAWNIWTNSNATYGQRYIAGAYMSLWGGAHIGLVAGLFMLGTEYALVAKALNVGINVGVDALFTILGGEKYNAQKAVSTAAFSYAMGAFSGRITAAIGTGTGKQLVANMASQSALQIIGNTSFRLAKGEPTMLFDTEYDLAAGVMSAIILGFPEGNPTALGHISEAASALYTGIAPFGPKSPTLIGVP